MLTLMGRSSFVEIDSGDIIIANANNYNLIIGRYSRSMGPFAFVFKRALLVIIVSPL